MTMQNGFIQFTDVSGKGVTTNGSLSFIKVGDTNLAFYGSRGKSILSDAEMDTVHSVIGLPVPQATVAAGDSDDDDDGDFTLPS